METQIVTPAEAMFALYRDGAENGATIVYNIPDADTARQIAAQQTSYLITSPNSRVPEERVIFGLDAEGLPYIVDVEF